MHLLANNLPTFFPSAQPDMLSGTFAPPPNEPWAFHYFEERKVFLFSPPTSGGKRIDGKKKCWKRIAGPTLISLRFESVWLGLTGNETVVTAGEIFTLGPPSTLAKQSLFIIHIKHSYITHWPARVYWLVVIVLHTSVHTGSVFFLLFFCGEMGGKKLSLSVDIFF